MATQTMTILEEPGNEVKDLPENVMSVGGGVGDEAADVTYSTKPDNKGVPLSQTKITEINTKYNVGIGQGMSSGAISHTGSIMSIGGGAGDNALDVTYSTKPNRNISLGSPTYNTITKEFASQGREVSQTENVLGVGGGIGEDAVDVSYSTKPDNNIGLGAKTFTTTTTTTTNRYGLGFGQISGEETTISGSEKVMGVGGGVGDKAVDVNYSTKPDNGGIRMGYEEISRMATNTISTTGEDLDNLKIYNRATILQDKVQHIIQKEIQPIIKTVIKPIIQKEIQPIVQREIQPNSKGDSTYY